MKISTRLRIAQLCCLVLLLLMGAVFTATTLAMRREVAKAEVTGEILRAAHGLRYLSLEYVMHHETRSRLQWLQRHQSLGRLLAGAGRFDTDDELALMTELRGHARSIGGLFDELQGLQEELRRTPARRQILLELEARLTGMVMQRAQNMMSNAEELTRLSSTHILAAQHRAMLAAGALGTMVLGVVLWAMGLTIRSVTAPLTRLHKATEAVDGGSLDFALHLHSNDEIGSLARAFNQMLERLQQSTVSRNDLLRANQALQREMSERQAADARVLAQLNRMNLLQQITRSIAERQDLHSIFQVVIRSLEDQLPVDFGAICIHADGELVVSCVGVRSYELSMTLAMTEAAHIPIDRNGLSRCAAGQLVYEADIGAVDFPFPQRLAKAGLASMVLAPLLAESTVFGMLIVARRTVGGFSSTDCEFLRQLSEHVALAANQAKLYATLQQAYADLHHSQAQITKQERLRALGQMASGIAHDINNAISPIGLYAEALLENEQALSDRGRASLQVIERAIDDVAATVGRMREFYRQREPQVMLSTVNINLMLQHVIDLTRARWSDMPQQRGIVIEMRQDLAPELPAILGMEGEIREALTNLVFNAIDALPDGGVVTLRTRHLAQGDDTGADPQVLVEVGDDGAGMDEATQRRCLEPFFTTKGERGTGLGLATVYGMIERHSGRINIASRPGAGTVVGLYFPVRADAVPGAAPPAAASAPAPLKILIVDDDPTLLASLSSILTMDGHAVTEADGGQAGIDLFAAAHADGAGFALVITDLGMPYVDGRKVAEATKRLAPAVPVILLTGWGQRMIPDSDDGPVNVDLVLSKPPKLRELRGALLKCTAPAP
ncbi:ATP-binding protein [Burkholderia sp. LMU1-1-1.1]|uniref:ATP-binding protein n=1 Tax=Burkholderia sp. LMU1-1-1.1 TaxID=3135266 RepID=UPI0034268A2D